MESLAGKTGIVIHAGISDGGGTVGKLLHALHLDKLLGRLGEGLAKNYMMVIVLDGTERQEPFYEAHFVECSPGEHEVSICPRYASGVPYSPASTVYQLKTLRVTVPAGELVHMVYTPGGVGQVKLELGQGPT